MKKLCFGLAAFYLVAYLLLLGIRPLMIPDEVRYAEIPREILVTGDWSCRAWTASDISRNRSSATG